MAALLRQGVFRINSCSLVKCMSPFVMNGISRNQCVTASTIADKVGESFWDKNKRLQRPTSPHLTIYKWEITASMSIAHRTTGVLLASGLYSFGIGTLFLSGNFPSYLTALQSMHLGSSCIFIAKFVLAFPLLFHLCSGTRHLFWDLGKGFEIKSVYASGYTAIAVALASAAVVAAL